MNTVIADRLRFVIARGADVLVGIAALIAGLLLPHTSPMRPVVLVVFVVALLVAFVLTLLRIRYSVGILRQQRGR